MGRPAFRGQQQSEELDQGSWESLQSGLILDSPYDQSESLGIFGPAMSW